MGRCSERHVDAVGIMWSVSETVEIMKSGTGSLGLLACGETVLLELCWGKSGEAHSRCTGYIIAPLSKGVLRHCKSSFQRKVNYMRSIRGTEVKKNVKAKTYIEYGAQNIHPPTHLHKHKSIAFWQGFRYFGLYILSFPQIDHSLIYATSLHRKKLPLNF